MSIFSMGGNIGFAVGPAVAAGIALVGLHWSSALFLPGIALTVLLALFAPDVRASATSVDPAALRQTLRRSWGRLSLIVGVIAIRSGAQLAMIILLPLYVHAHGHPAQIGSYGAVVLSLSGALGGLVGGQLSDMYGRRIVVVGSLLLAAPLLLLALMVPGPLFWPLMALSGGALLASNSVTVVQGQELMPENTGLASGITMGLAFGLSGVITSSMTTAVDHLGITTVIFAVPVLAFIAACLGALTSPMSPAVSRLSLSGRTTRYGTGSGE